MVTNKECDTHIPTYSPQEVFEVGTRFDALPKGQSIDFIHEPGVERFAEGVTVGLCIGVLGSSQEIECTVKEFECGTYLRMEGKSHKIGNAAVWLSLKEDEQLGGTRIEYGLSIDHNKRSLGLVVPIRHILNGRMLPDYSAAFTQNVIDILDERSSIRRAS